MGERFIAPGAGTARADSAHRSLSTENLTRTLARIRDVGGTVSPDWCVLSPTGFRYFGAADAERTEAIQQELSGLAAAGYLVRHFFDRQTLCPNCGSHRLNVREACPECASTDISGEPLISHYRCGFVGPRGVFAGAGDKAVLTCPKCGKRVEHLGTDHDIPGVVVRCNACQATFQEPPVRALCLACLTESPAEDLGSRTLWSYTLSPRGHASLEGMGAEQDPLGAPVFHSGPGLLLLLRHELRRAASGGRSLRVVVFQARNQNQLMTVQGKPLLDRLAERAAATDVLGLMDGNLAMLAITSDAPRARDEVGALLSDEALLSGMSAHAVELAASDLASLSSLRAAALKTGSPGDTQ